MRVIENSSNSVIFHCIRRLNVTRQALQPKQSYKKQVFMQAELFADLPSSPDDIVGVDEAGRGPLAGPVAAAAVILPSHYDLPGLTDSKALTAKQRAQLEQKIKQIASSWAIGGESVAEIDALNILQASMLAMQRACKSLHLSSHQILIDGNHIPKDLPRPAQAIVKGDSRIPAIAAASILAKTA